MERTAAIPPAGRLVPRSPKRILTLRSDDRLVDLVRTGDDVAFEVLYERHIAGVLGFCRHMLGSQAEAEDAVQQAFLSAHGAMRRGGREIAFKPWLYTIARNRCLSMLRARREQPGELPEISTAGLNEQVERSAELRELVADVQRLPEQQRAALVLSELGDLSHAEVAEVIGSPPQAIKGLVFRARQALAERRDARAADCGDIRLELAAARGGALRRGRLRYHLEACPGCVAYLEEVRRQRKLLAVALPVVPTLALKESVVSSVGAGAAGAAGLAGSGVATGGAVATGGVASTALPLLGGTAAKLAVAGVLLVGGAGVATEVVRDGSERPSAPPAAGEPVGQPGGSAPVAPAAPVPGVGGGPAEGGRGAARAEQRRKGQRGLERGEHGQRIARERGGKGRPLPGELRGRRMGQQGGAPGNGLGRPTESPGGKGGRSEATPGRLRGQAAPPGRGADKAPAMSPGNGWGKEKKRAVSKPAPPADGAANSTTPGGGSGRSR